MRINELCESIDLDFDAKQDKHGLGFDLKDDLLFFMQHDDDAYRKHTFPAIVAHKDIMESGGKEDLALFDKAVKECYQMYRNKFQHIRLPKQLDEETLGEICQAMLEEETNRIQTGFYEVK